MFQRMCGTRIPRISSFWRRRLVPISYMICPTRYTNVLGSTSQRKVREIRKQRRRVRYIRRIGDRGRTRVFQSSRPHRPLYYFQGSVTKCVIYASHSPLIMSGPTAFQNKNGALYQAATTMLTVERQTMLMEVVT